MVLRKEFVLMFWFIIIYSFVGRGLFERNTKGSPSGCLQVDGLLPYTGVGSGFIRVRELDDKIEVLNDEKRKEVIVTFRRESNQGSVRVTEQSNGVTKKSNQEK